MTDEPFTGTAYFMLFSKATAPKYYKHNSADNKSVSRKESLVDAPFSGNNNDKRSAKSKNGHLKLIVRDANYTFL